MYFYLQMGLKKTSISELLISKLQDEREMEEKCIGTKGKGERVEEGEGGRRGDGDKHLQYLILFCVLVREQTL